MGVMVKLLVVGQDGDLCVLDAIKQVTVPIHIKKELLRLKQGDALIKQAILDFHVL